MPASQNYNRSKIVFQKVDSNQSSKKGKLIFLIFVIIVFSIGIFGWTSNFYYSNWIRGLTNFSFNDAFGVGDTLNSLNLIEGIKGKSEGRTNILIISKDTERNTDSIIVMTYFHNQRTVSTFNLPRDLKVNDGYSIKKINALWSEADYRYQNKVASATGEEFFSGFLSKQLSLPIHYWVRVNIDGVAKIIDELGGINVNVDNSFTDCEFPNSDYSGYIRPCPRFEKGDTVMNSATALIYSRSRKSFDNPEEAIDFARSKRQSKVIEAVFRKLNQKLNDGSLVLDLGKLTSLINILGENVSTSMDLKTMLGFSFLVKDKDFNREVVKYSLNFESEIICQDNANSDIIFCDNTYLGQGVYSPSQNKFKKIIANILDQAKIMKLEKLQIAIVGNGSDVTEEVKSSLIEAGINPSRILIDNQFNLIKPAQINSQEKATIYINDETNFNNFKQSEFIADYKYELINDTQTKYKFTLGFANADIIILVESI
jgi:polyisoprenyl-teichoic acid--peptidoglycan teichoic acid transferase